MKKSVLALGALALLFPGNAGASSRFQSFGNLGVGDCAFESFANLVLADFPDSHITTSQVLSAYRANNGPIASLNFFYDQGFDGHRAALEPVSVTPGIDSPVWVDLAWGHAVMVLRATQSRVLVVDDGAPWSVTWSDWRSFYFTKGSQAYLPIWQTPNTYAVTYQGSYETSTMTEQDAPDGEPTTLEPLGFVNDGYDFLGWATTQNSNKVAYQPGDVVTSGHTLYALWSYVG